MNTLDIIKRILSEAEGEGTSVDSRKSLENQRKREIISKKSADLKLKHQRERETLARQSAAVKEEVVAEGAPIVVALAPIDVRNPKKAPLSYRNKGDIVPPTKPPSTEKRGVKGRPGQRPMPTHEEVEELDELSTKKLSDYSDKASDDVHRLDKEGNTKKANKRFDGVVRASDKMTDNGKKLRGTPMKEEKKMKGEDPCWKGYEMIGKKMKNGKEVPNCVPKEGVKEETIAESGGVKVFKTDAGHIEKYGENNFAVYLDGKKQKAYDSLEAAKKALASGKDQEELDEAKVGDTVSFHRELKAAPGKKVKKSGTVEKVEGDVVHVKVKDKYGVMRHQVKSGDLVKEESEQMNEASKYQIYHPSYSSAVQHAVSQAEKQGFTVDMDDYTQKVAFGPKKPSAGKTNSFSITLMDKNGKISKKKLQMQVYGMEGGKYELNMYTEEAEHITELSKKTLSSYVDKAIERAREMPGTGTNAEASKKTKRYAAVANAAYRTQGLAPRKGTDMFKKYKAEGVDVNEAENKPKKSYKDMKKKLENTNDKDIKVGEKLSGKQEPIDLEPTIDNNR